MSSRGIIVSHNVSKSSKGLTISGAIESAELKKILLYWDRISYPEVNGLGPNLYSLPELKYLVEEGILSVDSINVNPEGIVPGYPNTSLPGFNGIPFNHLPDIFAAAQIQMAADRLKSGEIWNIAQVGGQLSFSSNSNSEAQLIEFSLYNCLPVPAENASFEDIVRFRHSRESELTDLRKNLEKLRQDVISSDNPQRALILTSESINESLSAIHRLLDENKINHFFSTLNLYLNLNPSTVVASGLGALLAKGADFPLEIGASAGLAASTGLTMIERLVSGGKKIPPELQGYLYLYNARKFGITK